jgi:hypothetical protein
MQKLKVAEEVFLTVRELSTDRSFRWQQWIDSYDAVYGPGVWLWQKDSRGRSHRHGHMSAWTALRRQIRHGTIKKIGRGLYFFVEDRPRYPLFAL